MPCPPDCEVPAIATGIRPVGWNFSIHFVFCFLIKSMLVPCNEDYNGILLILLLP
jgi:hypothetical protein